MASKLVATILNFLLSEHRYIFLSFKNASEQIIVCPNKCQIIALIK